MEKTLKDIDNVVSLFLESAERYPERIALADRKGKVAYSDLLNRVRSRAAGWSAKGLSAGDRVLVFVPMSVQLYETVLALLYLGAVPVFLDEWSNIGRIRLALRIASCRGIVSGRLTRILSFLFPEGRNIRLFLSKDKGDKEFLSGPFPAGADSSALITFTSGTTGIPKAADRSHGYLGRQFFALQQEIRIQSGDVICTNLPVVMLLGLACGATSVIPAYNSRKPWKTDFRFIAEQLSRFRVNFLIGSPYFLLNTGRKSGQGGSDIGKLVVGGAAVFKKQAEELFRSFPDAALSLLYGSTEAEPVCSIDGREFLRESGKPGVLLGRPVENMEVKILPLQGQAVSPSGGGEKLPGEILLSGPLVLQTYINPEISMESKIELEGKLWHRTGDAGYLDDRGRLWLTGRVKYMLRKNGFLSPLVYEEALLDSPVSYEGTALENGRETVVAVALKPGCRSGDVRQYLSDLGLSAGKVAVFHALPRDKRHFSRPDYEKIKACI